MGKSSIVGLRAYQDGLHLVITPTLSVADVTKAVQQEFARLNQPLAGVSVQIDMQAPLLTEADLDALKTELQDTYGMVVRGINIADGPDASTASRVEEHPRAARTERGGIEKTRVVRETIRSGQTEDFPEGNLIIYGDVNPGGEVSAGGDIIVLGSLRGSAHAGMNGKLTAVIVAMNLVPLQLQIGNYISRPFVGQKSRGYPEIARVGMEDIIIVEEFVKL